MKVKIEGTIDDVMGIVDPLDYKKVAYLEEMLILRAKADVVIEIKRKIVEWKHEKFALQKHALAI